MRKMRYFLEGRQISFREASRYLRNIRHGGAYIKLRQVDPRMGDYFPLGVCHTLAEAVGVARKMAEEDDRVVEPSRATIDPEMGMVYFE